MKKFQFLVLVVFILVGCQSTISNQQAVDVPMPDDGKATAVGQIVHMDGRTGYTNTDMRLAEVFSEQGAYVLNDAFSPGATSDDQGYFTFENIPAGEYIFIIGDPMGDHVIITDEEGKAKIWSANVDQVSDWGRIKVKFPSD